MVGDPRALAAARQRRHHAGALGRRDGHRSRPVTVVDVKLYTRPTRPPLLLGAEAAFAWRLDGRSYHGCRFRDGMHRSSTRSGSRVPLRERTAFSWYGYSHGRRSGPALWLPRGRPVGIRPPARASMTARSPWSRRDETIAREWSVEALEPETAIDFGQRPETFRFGRRAELREPANAGANGASDRARSRAGIASRARPTASRCTP